jgi:hypothetical protein
MPGNPTTRAMIGMHVGVPCHAHPRRAGHAFVPRGLLRPARPLMVSAAALRWPMPGVYPLSRAAS